MFAKLYKTLSVILFYFSKEKKLLDWYVRKMINLERLSDSEVVKFKELAEYRKKIYAR